MSVNNPPRGKIDVPAVPDGTPAPLRNFLFAVRNRLGGWRDRIFGLEVRAAATELQVSDAREAAREALYAALDVSALSAAQGADVDARIEGAVRSIEGILARMAAELVDRRFAEMDDLKRRLVEFRAAAEATVAQAMEREQQAQAQNRVLVQQFTLQSARFAENRDLEYAREDIDTITVTVENLTTTDVPEGSNLYYTESRADARVAAGLAALTTTDVPEGSNLYFTDARARTALTGTANVFGTTQTIGVEGVGSGNLVLRKASGSAGSPTQVASAATVAGIFARGYDGTAYRDVAQILAITNGAVTSADSSGYLSVRVTRSGSTTPTELFRFNDDGSVTLTALAAAPSGADGKVYFDSTLGKFRGYAAGAWRDFH